MRTGIATEKQFFELVVYLYVCGGLYPWLSVMHRLLIGSRSANTFNYWLVKYLVFMSWGFTVDLVACVRAICTWIEFHLV